MQKFLTDFGNVLFAGYVPNPETSEPVFSAPGRSEDDIKQMLYRTELNVQLFNTALEEAG